MKIHCFFEQSGTFKNVIKNMGGVAKDYDILNDYGQTDVMCDLYDEIEKAYWELTSIFDKIKSDDMIIALYWFVNCKPQNNILFEPLSYTESRGTIEDTHNKNMRSEISPQYAERFIKQYIAKKDGERYFFE